MRVAAFCATPAVAYTPRTPRIQRTQRTVRVGTALTRLSLQRLRDLRRGEGARSTVQAGAWMGARSAEKQAIDRGTVARAAEERPRDEPLIERELAVEDVPAGHAVRALEIERRDHLSREDGRVEPR